MESTIELITQHINNDILCQIVVVNAAKIVLAQKDNILLESINSAEIVGADGMPVVWVSRLFKPNIPGRVNGTDLMEELIKLSVLRGYSIYFLGATQDVIERTIDHYQGLYPNLKVAGFRNGYFSGDQELEVVTNINSSKPDILFIGISTPQKEKFVKKYRDVLKVKVIHGVGGSFDVSAGKTKRAPLWMQNSGLEWFHRLIQEPKRMWRRYLFTNVIFIYYVFLKAFRIREFKTEN